MRTGNKYQIYRMVNQPLTWVALITVLLFSSCESDTIPATKFDPQSTVESGTVIGEVLGSGDASLANQSFKLQKNPLTYESSSSALKDSWVASTLEVYVNDIPWKEVPNLLEASPNEQVFVVSQNDKGEATVRFGDGRHGSRLPTGTDNIIANYRYGD